jgi:hypothetical protein
VKYVLYLDQITTFRRKNILIGNILRIFQKKKKKPENEKKNCLECGFATAVNALLHI